MELLKMLSASEIVAQIISFLIVFFLLRAFFWKPILGALESRRSKISSDFKDIEDRKAAADRLRLDYEERIKSIEQAAAAKVREALLEGQKAAEDLKQTAHKEADRIIEEGRSDLMRQITKAKEELRGEIASLALSATERLLQEKITQEKDRQLIDDFLEQVEKVK
jgi:F-type H+-transporting ATPase subunit b